MGTKDRTIMLGELSLLLEAVPGAAEEGAYQRAILDDNALLKRTLSTRRKSLRHLRELYGLDVRFVLFEPLRALWDESPQSRPLLALLTSLVRDALLRASCKVIVDAPEGAEIRAENLARAVQDHYPARLTAEVAAKVGRNAASSWTQSGHLAGRYHKVRQRVGATPAVTAYAMLIGWEPDLNDGVRLNIRPFVTAGILRSKFTVHWNKDRGTDPKPNASGTTERLNDLHLTRADKTRARSAQGAL